jgi:hypothetical protein
MHVKYIHDLCTLLIDIPPYFHHILVIFMLPMVVAPEAIVKSFSSIGSSILSSHIPNCIILLLNLSGARLARPMVVAPKVMRGCLQPFIDSSISSSQLFLFFSCIMIILLCRSLAEF